MDRGQRAKTAEAEKAEVGHIDMTLPHERTRAVLAAKKFLLRLSNSRAENGIKAIPKSVREEARAILRHYPFWFDLNRKDAFDEKTAIQIAEQEDGLA